MPVESFGFIDDLVETNPLSGDGLSAADDHFRGIKSTLKTTFPNADRAFRFPTVSAETEAFTVDADNTLWVVDASGGAVTATLPAVGAVPAGYLVAVKRVNSGANAVTIDGNGSETIDGALTVILSRQYQAVLLENDGTEWHIVRAYGGTQTTLAGYGITDAAAITQDDEVLYGAIFGGLSDRDYRIVIKAAHAGTITETTTRSVSGTATATFKINTTALGGTANAVSSSEQSRAHASANAFVAGDDIVITISSNSACVDLSFSIKYTRTLD